MAILVNPFEIVTELEFSNSCDWTECQGDGCDGYNGCNV